MTRLGPGLLALVLAAIALPTAASAADLPVAGATPGASGVAPPYNWSSVYIGINGGYAFGNSNWTDPRNPLAPGVTSSGAFDITGGMLGGTVGLNLQVRQLVLGAEADIDYASIAGSVASTNGFCSAPTGGFTTSCQTQDSWLGTARLRVGYAFDRYLFFGTGGAAAGNIQAVLTNGSTASITVFDSTVKAGWTLGGGFEFGFNENFSGRIEYLYVNLGNGSCTVVAQCGLDKLGAAPNDTVKFTTNVIRAGLNFKFNLFR
jgi:outer membrane immunogenic protein